MSATASKSLTRDEVISRKVDALIAAKGRAAEDSRCKHCSRPATLAVDMAEQDLLATVESLFAIHGIA